jgi:hypothetical protein
MLCQPYEVEISQEHLQTVMSKVRGPLSLLGGWAVYVVVGENFKREQGRDYLGSRDIDLGFHIEKEWSRDELENSSLAVGVRTLIAMGFEPMSFRLVKHFHTDTKQELLGEDMKRTPSYEIFDLFVDPIVDHIHPETREILGFIPIDEPLLEHVFVERKHRIIEFYDRDVFLPIPPVLLATKLKSVRNRDKEHKRIKDIADIYALSWYSDEKLASMKTALSAILPPQETRTIVDSFTKEDFDMVSNVLGTEASQIRHVLNALKS